MLNTPSPSWRKLSLTTAVVIAAAAAVAGCGSSSSSSSSTSASTANATPAASTSSPAKLTNVTFGLSWTVGADVVPWVVGIEKGWYKQAGMNVKLVPGEASTDTLKEVATGQEPMGYVYGPPDVLLAQQSGLPVVSFFAYFEPANFGLISKKATGITTAADLKGKRIGITPIPIDQASFNALLASAHLTRSDVTVVNVGYDGYQDLLAGKVDASSALTYSEGELMREAHMPYNFLSYNPPVPNYPFETMVANGSFLKDHPNLVKGFASVTARAIDWSLANPRQAVQILVKAYPNLSFNAMYPKFVYGYGTQYRTPLTAAHGLGYQSPQIWAAMATFMKQQGLLHGNVDTSATYTNAFIDSSLK